MSHNISLVDLYAKDAGLEFNERQEFHFLVLNSRVPHAILEDCIKSMSSQVEKSVRLFEMCTLSACALYRTGGLTDQVACVERLRFIRRLVHIMEIFLKCQAEPDLRKVIGFDEERDTTTTTKRYASSGLDFIKALRNYEPVMQCMDKKVLLIGLNLMIVSPLPLFILTGATEVVRLLIDDFSVNLGGLGNSGPIMLYPGTYRVSEMQVVEYPLMQIASEWGNIDAMELLLQHSMPCDFYDVARDKVLSKWEAGEISKTQYPLLWEKVNSFTSKR